MTPRPEIPPRRHGRTWRTAAGILAVLSALVLANRSHLLLVGWQLDEISRIESDGGLAYSARTGHSELSHRFGYSIAEVREDGRALPHPAGSRDEVRRAGNGAYVFWNATVYFSTPDHSDPRRNGRRYEVYRPATLGDGPAFGLYALTLAALAGAGVSIRRGRRDSAAPDLIKRWTKALLRPSRSWTLSIPTFIFIATRASFFLHFPLVGFSGDTGGYIDLVRTVERGSWPLFVIRTPGYPALIWLATRLGHRWLNVILAQSLISLAASLSLVAAVHRIRPGLALAAALGVGGFLGSSQVLIYETSALSDSLYASGLVFSAAALILALGSDRSWPLAAAAVAIGGTILVRPAGMFLVVIFGLTLAYLAWNRLSWRKLAAGLAPLPVLLLGLGVYNYATLGQFVISAFGEANLAAATVLFWEPDPSLPPPINRSLAELPASYRRVGVTPEDLDLLRGSWDPMKLYDLFVRSYNPMSYGEGWTFGHHFGTGDYLASRPMLRRVSRVAIRRHPVLYLKFVWANLAYFFAAIDYKFEFYTVVAWRAELQYASANPGYDRNDTMEFQHRPLPPSVVLQPAAEGSRAVLGFPWLRRVHQIGQFWHWMLFQNFLWLAGYLAVTCASAVQLLRFRGRHDGAFLLLALGLMPVGAGLLTCLVETALERYSYPTQFVYYLVVALAPLLGASRLRLPSPR